MDDTPEKPSSRFTSSQLTVLNASNHSRKKKTRKGFSFLVAST